MKKSFRKLKINEKYYILPFTIYCIGFGPK